MRKGTGAVESGRKSKTVLESWTPRRKRLRHGKKGKEYEMSGE
jgi:hypothetical protein